MYSVFWYSKGSLSRNTLSFLAPEAATAFLGSLRNAFWFLRSPSGEVTRGTA